MKKQIAIPALIAVVVAACYAKLVMSEVAIMEMHPEIDDKTIIKAHRIMVRRSFAGRYNDVDIENDENWNQIFLAIVQEITTK